MTRYILTDTRTGELHELKAIGWLLWLLTA
jgi:hypothetical protein